MTFLWGCFVPHKYEHTRNTESWSHATQVLDYSLNISVTCSVSYITRWIFFSFWIFVLSYFHRNSGWIAFFTMATVTPVSIGQELPSCCWWCWDSSVVMVANQRAGNCPHERLYHLASTVSHGFILFKATARSVFLYLVNYNIRRWRRPCHVHFSPPPSCLNVHLKNRDSVKGLWGKYV